MGLCNDVRIPDPPRAVDFEDIEALRDLLDAGADIQQEHGGLTLLQHAVDVEIDSHNQVLRTSATLTARPGHPVYGVAGH